MSNELSASDKLWQKKLLPFMVISLIVLTIFFIVASYAEFRDFKNRLDASNKNQEELLRVMNAFGDSPVQDETIIRENKENGIEYVKWRTAALLERESLNRRYNHSQSIIFSRMWTRYLGFITGMILAIVGAVFILGKLREDISEVGGESAIAKLSVKSASPGIILAVLGTVLLLTTLAVQFDAAVSDGNIYLNNLQNVPDKPKPANPNNLENTKVSNPDSTSNQSANNQNDSSKKAEEVKRQLANARQMNQQNPSR